MRLEMTVRCAGGATSGVDVDLVVDAAPGARLSEVLPDLLRAVGSTARDAPVSVGGAPVPADAVLGRPPLLRGAVLTVGRLPAERPGPADGPGGPLLRVMSGPDAGASAVLPLGRSWLGRSAGSLLALSDPTASRRHVELESAPAGTRVRDAGSANGALLDGRPLTGSWTPLLAGALLQVGAAALQVCASPAAAGGTPRRLAADGLGGLLLDPSPDPPPAPPGPVEVVLPTPPAPPPGTPVAWAAVLAPALVAVPLALLWSPVALLLAATGPLVAVVTAVGDRRRRARQHARDLTDHRAAVRRARGRAERGLADERAVLEEQHPGPVALLELVRHRGPLLWAAEAVAGAPAGAAPRWQVRLGTGTVPAGVALVDPDPDPDPDGGAATAAAREPLVHAAGPVVVGLTAARRVAVTGTPAVARSAARALVCQLAVLHPPERLRLRVVTDRPQEWAWTRWLPHARDAAQPEGPEGGVQGGVQGGPDGGPGSAAQDGTPLLLVVDAAGAAPPEPLRESALVLEVGTAGAGTERAGAERAELHVRAGGGATWTTRHTAPAAPTPLVADLVSASWAEELARHLAPLRTTSGERARGAGPACAPSLSELLGGTLGPDPLDPRAVAAAWDAPRSTAVATAVGVRPDGSPWVVDLDRDGPHALVAGTTGAGKSSLLVAWLLSMAVAVPPEELSVVLVDYKGGATACRLRGLPHLVGSVTDLDEHLAHRALASLTAEVRRRERVLAELGASDRAELLRARPGGARLLPRLVVVVDEVRVLLDEVPDLVPGLVRLAAVGRSLGVHLVLATQRPAGAVSADARANTNLRVALRVRDAADSLDVLDDPGAADLHPARVGAALVRRGGGDLEPVQVASLSRRPARPARVRVAGSPGSGEAAGVGRVDDVDEVPLLVASLQRASRHRGSLPSGSPAPWLPPLPDLLPWRHPDDVPRALLDGEDDGEGLPLGLLDEPAVPSQRLLRWGADAPLAVCGGPGSGRTSLLRWLAVAAGAGGREVHLVGDRAELADLARLPHVASTVDPDDGEHLVRLLAHLADADRDRRGQPPPILLVDGADRVLGARAARGQRHEAEAAADLLAGLLDAGLPVALTGGAAALSSRALAGVREVLLLAPADRTAAVLAGVPSASTPGHWPPGRALRLRPGPLRECQLPLLDDIRVDGLHGSSRRAAPAPPVPQLPPLPSHLPRAGLPTGGTSLLVGVGGLRAAPVGLELPAGGGALVLGPPGSGRSSALHLLAAQAGAAGRTCVLVRPRTPAHSTPTGDPGQDDDGRTAGLRVVAGTGAAAAQALLEALSASGAPPGADPSRPPLVLVDDAELVLGSPLESLLLDLAAGAGPACAVVAAGTGTLLPGHRGLAVALRRHRTGLLLHPVGPGDAELLGTRPPVVRGGPPGRASLVRAGALAVVQLAQP